MRNEKRCDSHHSRESRLLLQGFACLVSWVCGHVEKLLYGLRSCSGLRLAARQKTRIIICLVLVAAAASAATALNAADHPTGRLGRPSSQATTQAHNPVRSRACQLQPGDLRDCVRPCGRLWLANPLLRPHAREPRTIGHAARAPRVSFFFCCSYLFVFLAQSGQVSTSTT